MKQGDAEQILSILAEMGHSQDRLGADRDNVRGHLGNLVARIQMAGQELNIEFPQGTAHIVAFDMIIRNYRTKIESLEAQLREAKEPPPPPENVEAPVVTP